jgi:hypothetical protein
MEPNCIDLRPIAKAKRWKWRYEESFKVERAENRGDSRWYVEILCKYGLIYPWSETHLAAYGKARKALEIMPFHRPLVGWKQAGHGEARVVFEFERLDEVAAILMPRMKRQGRPPTQASLDALRRLHEKA